MAVRFDSFSLNELVAKPDDAFRLCSLAMAGGQRVQGYGGDYFRMYEFCEGTVARDAANGTEDFRLCGKAFGSFQRQLADFPAQRLHEIIKNFHNTPWRYENLMNAVDNDPFV